MRYNLRTMLIAGAIAPPLLAWLWLAFGFFLILPAIYAIAIVLILDGHT